MKRILIMLLMLCAVFGTAFAAGKTTVSIEETGPVILVKGETCQLHAALSPEGSQAKLTWSSTKKKVATVDKEGTVTAIAEGTTTIRVKTASGKAATVEVQVRARTDEEILATVTDCDQVCLVRYQKGSKAAFSFWELTEDKWTRTFSCDAYVGKRGIGKTKEGDKKTPTGTYGLTVAFGILEDPGALMDYHQVTETDYWCSTGKSKYYNQLVDTTVTDYKATKADEHLIKVKVAYDYALALDYNADCVPGKGSAIFLHCMGKNTSTSGCIAIPTDKMVQLLKALRPGGKIVIFE